ncbi:MAG: TRAP transporter substrate-binding protein [Castellaniella sp.]
MKKTLLLATTTLALMGLTAGAQSATKWDLPSGYPASNLHTQNLQEFAKDVDALSSGDLKITIHDNASLFKAPEIKRAVQGNQAQIGEILLNNFANDDPIYALDGLPFLTSDFDSAWKLYQAQKEQLDKKLNAQGMKLLYSVAWPPQGLYANKDVESVADMKDLKWRAYSPVTARIAELVQAQPVTIQQSELAQAMATGVINSFMTSGSTGWDTKVYEHIKNFYDVQAWQPKNVVIVNLKAYNQLSENARNALLEASDKAEQRGWALSKEKTQWYLDQLADNGMNIRKPSEKLMTELREVGKTMIAEWLEKAGDDGREIIEAYQASMKQ